MSYILRNFKFHPLVGTELHLNPVLGTSYQTALENRLRMVDELGDLPLAGADDAA